jgi:hypothetical protein
MDARLKATNYTSRDLTCVPVDWTSKPELRWDDVSLATGFDPRGNEVSWGQLSASWNGHPAGAAVLTGFQGKTDWFTVIDAGEVLASSSTGKPFRICRRSLHRDGRVAAFEFAMADPATGEIYKAAPRVRCRPSQQTECRKLFGAQASAWARGETVPWSRYLPQS